MEEEKVVEEITEDSIKNLSTYEKIVKVNEAFDKINNKMVLDEQAIGANIMPETNEVPSIEENVAPASAVIESPEVSNEIAMPEVNNDDIAKDLASEEVADDNTTEGSKGQFILIIILSIILIALLVAMIVFTSSL